MLLCVLKVRCHFLSWGKPSVQIRPNLFFCRVETFCLTMGRVLNGIKNERSKKLPLTDKYSGIQDEGKPLTGLRSRIVLWSVQVDPRVFISVGGGQGSLLEFKSLTPPQILMKATKFIGY